MDSWQDHPVAIAAAAVAGAAMLVAGLYFTGRLDTGDEPPIRVKNGSLDFYLATNNLKWKSRGDVRHWKVSGGKRSKDPLDVAIAVNPGASCSAQAGTGDSLAITYNNGTQTAVLITIRTDPNDRKHTQVTSSDDLAVSLIKDSKGRMLTYEKEGFISGLTLTNGTTAVVACTFTKKDQLAELVILDY